MVRQDEAARVFKVKVGDHETVASQTQHNCIVQESWVVGEYGRGVLCVTIY